MVNGLHLYSAFIQSAVQLMPLIHPFTHTFTHQRRLAAMQGTNQLVRSNWGLGVLLRDTSTHPGWDRTGNPPTARRQLYLLSYIAPIISMISMISMISIYCSPHFHRQIIYFTMPSRWCFFSRRQSTLPSIVSEHIGSYIAPTRYGGL